MAKIIIYGDIDISPLYVSVDGEKEKKVSGKAPYSISVSSGTHHIFATSVFFSTKKAPVNHPEIEIEGTRVKIKYGNYEKELEI